MSFKNTGKRLIEEVPYGMYVWKCADGEYLGDDEGNIANVFCMKGDKRAIEAMTVFAKRAGYEDGEIEWWSGKRRITDEELEEQEARARLGLIPDPLDYGAIRDEQKGLRLRND
jgi:hypothetical protein